MTGAGNANASNHSGTFRQEDLSRIALLEKRLGGDMSPLNTAADAVASQQLAAGNDGQYGGPLNPGATCPPSDSKQIKDGKLPTHQASNPSNPNRPNDSNSSGGHLVSDTPLHSAEEGKTKDGERDTAMNTADKSDKAAGNSNTKRRVSKVPMRVAADERSNGGRKSMGNGGTKVTVDLTKDNVQGEMQLDRNNEQQEKRTPNQLQKSIERYFTLSNKQGSNQSVEEGLTHTSKDKGEPKGASEMDEKNEKNDKKREQSRRGPGSDRKEGAGKSPLLSSVEKSKIKSLEKQAASLVEENAHLHDQLKKTQAACDVLEEQLKRDGAGSSRGGGNEVSRALDHKRLSFVVELAKEHAVMSREIKTRQLQEDAPRLGTLSVQRKGIDVQEVWENGAAILKLGESYKDLQRQREQIDALRKATKRRLPLPGQPVPPRMDETMESVSETGPIHPDDWLVQEEVGDDTCCFCSCRRLHRNLLIGSPPLSRPDATITRHRY